MVKRGKITEITDILPEGWEAAAKAEGALQRQGRHIKTPKDLLRVLVLYGTEGKSYGMTAAILQITEEMPLTKNAVYERVLGSWKWLKWMCEHLCQEAGFLPAVPQWLKDYRVCLVDASNASVPGSTGADYRLHYMVEMFSLKMTEHHLTTAAEGETLTRYQNIQPKDLLIGDRIYGTLKGISHVRDHGAEFLLRFKAKSFNLYDAERNLFDLDALLKQWSPRKIIDQHLYCKIDNQYVPVRVCAIGKTVDEINQGERQTKRANGGKNRGKMTPLQEIYNRFVVVITSLPDSISAEKVLELYRMRWQIELVFKRMKSIFDLGDLESRKEDAVYAWFYIKLLIAAICEALVNRGRFPPAEK